MTPDDKNPAPPSPENAAIGELQRANYSLRTMIHMVALCGIVLSGAVFVYLFNELAQLRARNNELIAFVAKYNTNFVPMAENVRTNLAAYAVTHPTVAPILQKYYRSAPEP